MHSKKGRIYLNYRIWRHIKFAKNGKKLPCLKNVWLWRGFKLFLFLFFNVFIVHFPTEFRLTFSIKSKLHFVKCLLYFQIFTLFSVMRNLKHWNMSSVPVRQLLLTEDTLGDTTVYWTSWSELYGTWWCLNQISEPRTLLLRWAKYISVQRNRLTIELYPVKTFLD